MVTVAMATAIITSMEAAVEMAQAMEMAVLEVAVSEVVAAAAKVIMVLAVPSFGAATAAEETVVD